MILRGPFQRGMFNPVTPPSSPAHLSWAQGAAAPLSPTPSLHRHQDCGSPNPLTSGIAPPALHPALPPSPSLWGKLCVPTNVPREMRSGTPSSVPPRRPPSRGTATPPAPLSRQLLQRFHINCI